MTRKRRRRRGYGLSAEGHASRSKGTLREIRRLQRVLKDKLKSPPDCVHAANLTRALAQQEGAFWVDRHDGGGGRGTTSPSSRMIFDRFVKVCVMHPRQRNR